MPLSKTFNVTCACSKQKRFTLTVKVKENARATGIKVTEPCPMRHEKFCLQHIDLELPPGLEPLDDEIGIRNKD